MKYKHYAPDVPLILVKDSSKIHDVIEQEVKTGTRVGALISPSTAKNIQADKIIIFGENEIDMASRLYDSLRSFKKNDVDIIICESFSKKGVGEAVMDRLERAATTIV